MTYKEIPIKSSFEIELTNDNVNECQLEKGNCIKERNKWNNKIDFLFAIMGFCVGLGNVWRFPYLAFKNGGGAFLIVYYCGVIFGAVPVFLLEVMIGQFMNKSGPKVWSIIPLYKGIGYTSAIMLAYSNLLYNIIVTWIIYYLIVSFSYELPWTTCDNHWNTKHCFTSFDYLNNGSFNSSLNKSILMKSSADEYWQLKVLQSTDSFSEIGIIRLELLGSLALAWIMVYLCLFKGLGSTGKITYFTSTFPYVLMTIMLVKGLSLDGAWDGIKYFFKPDWNSLYSSQVWIEAVTQAFFSYALGIGTCVTLGSYNNKKFDSYKNVLMVSVISEMTCLIAGFVIFSVLGYMSKITGQDIKDVAVGGPGLAFIAYPTALSLLPLSSFWSLLFFLMLLIVSSGSQFMSVEAFVTTVTDISPSLRKHRKKILPIYCISCFLFSVLFITQGGIYWFEIGNAYAFSGWTMLIMMFAETIMIGYGYGADKFYEEMKGMLGYYPSKFWKYCWTFFTPLLIFIVFVFSIVQYQPFKYNDYEYPWYGVAIGWFICLSSIIWIPICAIQTMIKKYRRL